MKPKKGRPKLPKSKKRQPIYIKLSPEMVAAIKKIGENKTRIIEYALRKTFNLEC